MMWITILIGGMIFGFGIGRCVTLWQELLKLHINETITPRYWKKLNTSTFIALAGLAVGWGGATICGY
jgi:hypothetical protein